MAKIRFHALFFQNFRKKKKKKKKLIWDGGENENVNKTGGVEVNSKICKINEHGNHHSLQLVQVQPLLGISKKGLSSGRREAKKYNSNMRTSEYILKSPKLMICCGVFSPNPPVRRVGRRSKWIVSGKFH